MNIDERIEKLVTQQEKNEVLMARMLDGIMRLERIAGVLLISDEELDRRLTELEKPQ